jgi:hypothetical protein
MMEIEDPSRENERSDMELPRCKKSHTEMDAPRREKLLSDIEEPICA